MRQPRQRARHRKAAEPGTTATEPQGATEPSSTGGTNRRKIRMSPEALEKFGKLGVALMNATAQLIDAIAKLH
jgi:hypothetical protein